MKNAKDNIIKQMSTTQRIVLSIQEEARKIKNLALKIKKKNETVN